MAIKDWFGGGDKKKETFREEAKEALKGKLTPGKAQKLAEVAKRNQIDDPADDKTQLRREVFNQAVGQVKALTLKLPYSRGLSFT
jgi:hypothetical protein